MSDVELDREGRILFEGVTYEEDDFVCECGHPRIMHVDMRAVIGWCRHQGCSCRKWKPSDVREA